jgi:hypothetical protein
MQIYLKDIFTNDKHGENGLTTLKIPKDILLSCKIAFSEFIANANISNDECILLDVWKCGDIDELKKFIEDNNFEFELR